MQNFFDNKGLRIVILNVIYFIFAFGIFVLFKHFSTDDYAVYFDQIASTYPKITGCYRNAVGLISFLLSALNINMVRYQILLGVCLVVIFAISAALITYNVLEYSRIKSYRGILCVCIGTLLLFSNAFIGEWLYFTESYIQWILGVIGFTGGQYILEKKNLKEIVCWDFCIYC